MLIKEYRIPLPLTVEEYRIAQLYMIAKKSREESHGEGSGVEIIVNEPYTNGPGGDGQYTKKIYHVGSHLPGWIKSLLPKSALIVEEEAFNAYPYTKTRYTCPFVEKFLLEIETCYFSDNGYQENVFNLSGADLRNRIVDSIDIVKDLVTGADYLREEDPTIYVSKKTGRGPLDDDWLKKYWEAVQGKPQPTPDNKALMCAYKLCRVEFRYWGMQTKLEKFIHDIALRKTMVKAHRQAWAWQDEWYGLTMDDIREIEKQTQIALQRKMAGNDNDEDLNEENDEFETTSRNSTNQESTPTTTIKITSPNDLTVDESKSASDDEFYDCMGDTDSISIAVWSSMEVLSERDDNFVDRNPGFSSASANNSIALREDTEINHLILVFHGGSALDMTTDVAAKKSDATTFRGVVEYVMRQHYPFLVGHIAVKQVSCPDTCSDILNKISSINPYSFEATYAEGPLVADTQIGIIPLLLASKKDFQKIVDECIYATNKIYADFLNSDEGMGFHGQVTVIGDSIGSIFAYDALTKSKSKGHEDPCLHIHVTDFFIFGSPLALILSMRAYATEIFRPTKPQCQQIYNLFHPTDPVSCRLEPLIFSQMGQMAPVNIPRYSKYPKGNGDSLNLEHFIHIHPHIFMGERTNRRGSDTSIQSSASGATDMATLNLVSSLDWWGAKRIDYAMYCPDGLNNLNNFALHHVFYSSYWESCDVVAFVLRQISKLQEDCVGPQLKELSLSRLQQPREKWMRKRTSVKLKNVACNHRANDVVVREGEPQKLSARFMYGPLDMITLTGEKVDIYIINDPPSGEWSLYATEVTDKNGRITYVIPSETSLGLGVYPIKMVVRGDHTYVDFLIAVVPPQTPAVVFSIDGSFAASMSVTGKDPKVRPGAVDICRYWQDLGYLLIYVTGRPDMQQHKVLQWLAQHNFPHGLVSFADGLSTDPLGHKKTYLLNLTETQKIQLCYAYGSSKDITVYAGLGLESRQIFTVGKVSKKLQGSATVLADGYVAHLTHLKSNGSKKHVQGNTRMIISKRQFDFSNAMIRHQKH